MPNHFAGLDEEEESPIMAAELSHNSDGAIWDGTFCPCEAHCDHGMHIENDGSWNCQHLEIAHGGLMMFAWDKTDWADQMEEPDEATIARENAAFAERNGGMTIAMLLAEAAKRLEKPPVVITPFVPPPTEPVDPWARNADGSIMCCRNHAYKGVKGNIAPAENGCAEGCNAWDEGRACVGTHEGTVLFGKRFAHLGEDEWGLAKPREQGSTRPSSTGDWRSGTTTPTWRSGTSTPTTGRQAGCTNPLCRLPSGAQMTNHTLATCGKPGGGAHKGRR